MQVYDDGTRIIVWYYETLLPLCDDNVIFTNNRLLAENRFTYFERKMSRNNQFINGYMKFMKKLISKGYATESKVASENEKCWYLPQHGVYSRNRRGKIRIVLQRKCRVSRGIN